MRYFHGARITVAPDHYTRVGPDGSTWGGGQVFESDPPRRLVYTWRSLYDPDGAGAEPASRITWQIEPMDGGVCLLTTTHDQLDHSPTTAAGVHGVGWMTVLSGLKTLLETGEPMLGDDRASAASGHAGGGSRRR